MKNVNRETVYQIVDLFMAGTPAAEIAAAAGLLTLQVVEIVQSNDGQAYADQIREMRRMELEALADGPAVNAVRGALSSGVQKEALQAADMTFKATGKYAQSEQVVATLAEILKRVMEEAKK